MVKGFTLIELLIVIGILAILATTVVLVLNPAQILQETRDTQRISDLGTLRTALGLYLATVANPDLSKTEGGVDFACREAGLADLYWGSVTGVTNPFVAADVGGTMLQHGNVGRTVDGTGWVPVNLGAIPGGSPVSALPTDPTNTGGDLTTTTGFAYAYTCSGTTYEIDANMESGKYGYSGTPPDAGNVENTDGGNQANIYEVGSGPGLAL